VRTNTQEERRAWFSAVQAKRDAIRARIAELALEPCLLALPDRDGRIVHLICRDHEKPTEWRDSRLDALGPSGHSIGPTFAGALVAAWDYGGDVMRAVAVTPETVDAVVSALGIVVRAEMPKEVA
jgi:hypothetical protein